ncbi:thymidine kinase [[Mycoplasma] testudinis]|uniref:thymidine kinase n=1 Tax=[Mycoplasma] testudinis TaxID=33924 RepID=UPI00047FA3E4|nr:thymidine kinase [[Mycoplasma] testudinis]
MAKKNALSYQSGWVEVICGPMFAGKSEELIRKINRVRYAEVNFLVFKPLVDSRSKGVESRDGRYVDAIVVSDAYKIYDHVDEKHPDLVAIDEAQFFGNEIIEVVQTLADNGINVLIAGLERDFKGEPFGPIPALLTIAERITKLTAICTECGAEATRSQRLIDGKEAPYNSPQILIGNQESYTARCRHHHRVPGRPIHDRTTNFKKKLKTRELYELGKQN